MPSEILINPSVFQDKRDALAVAWNEALRLTMEDIGFEPKFAVTPEQARFFRNTAYSQDEAALRATIVARIATHDTSVSPTPEQEAETVRLLDTVLEMPGISRADAQTLQKMKASVQAGNARGPVRAPPSAASLEPQEGMEPPPAASAGAQEPEASQEAPVEAAEAPEGVQSAEGAGNVRPDPNLVPGAKDLVAASGARPAPVMSVVDRAIQLLSTVESNNNPGAVGDEGKAVGVLQMWPIAVRQANQLVGREMWSLEDRKDPQLSMAMAKVILNDHFTNGVTDVVDLAGRWRNPKGDAPRWYKDRVRKLNDDKVRQGVWK